MQLPIPWRRGQIKPFGSIPRINWGHPLAQGLKTYIYDAGGGVVIDLVQGDFVVYNNTTGRSLTGTYIGNAWRSSGGGFNYISSGANSTVIDNMVHSAPFSAVTGYVRTAANTAGQYGTIWCVANAATDTPFWIATEANTSNVTWFLGGAALRSFAFTPALNKFAVTALVMTTSTSGTGYHVDPTNGFNSQTNTEALGASTNHFPCVYNEDTAGGDFGFQGSMYFGAAWANRALTAAEVAQLYQDPWCLLTYPEDDIFATLVGVAAAATPLVYVPNGITDLPRRTFIFDAPPALPLSPGVPPVLNRLVQNAPAIHNPTPPTFSQPPTRPLYLTSPRPPILAPALHNPLALGRSEPPTRPLSLAIPVSPTWVPNAPAIHTPYAQGRDDPPTRPLALTVPVSTGPVLNAPAWHNPYPPGKSEPPAIGTFLTTALPPINAAALHNPLPQGRSEPPAIGWPTLQIATLAPIVFNPTSWNVPYAEGRSIAPAQFLSTAIQIYPPVANPTSWHNPFAPGRTDPTSGGFWQTQFPLANPAILTNSTPNWPLAQGRSEPPAYPTSVLAPPTPYTMGWFVQWDLPNYSKPIFEPTARTFIPLLPPPPVGSGLIQRTLTGVGL